MSARRRGARRARESQVCAAQATGRVRRAPGARARAFRHAQLARRLPWALVARGGGGGGLLGLLLLRCARRDTPLLSARAPPDAGLAPRHRARRAQLWSAARALTLKSLIMAPAAGGRNGKLRRGPSDWAAGGAAKHARLEARLGRRRAAAAAKAATGGERGRCWRRWRHHLNFEARSRRAARPARWGKPTSCRPRRLATASRHVAARCELRSALLRRRCRAAADVRVRPARANSPRACSACAGTARCVRAPRRRAAPRPLRATRAERGLTWALRSLPPRAAPGVREAVPRRERLQVPHHQRKPPAPGAPLLQRHARPCAAPRSRLPALLFRAQMAIFGQNPHKVVDNYSQQFERDFLEHLAMRCACPGRSCRVCAFAAPL